jgi:hypothetical protein
MKGDFVDSIAERFKNDFKEYYERCYIANYRLLSISLPLYFLDTNRLKKIFEKGLGSLAELVWLNNHTQFAKYSEILVDSGYDGVLKHPVYISKHTSTIHGMRFPYYKVYLWEDTLSNNNIYEELTTFLEKLKVEGYLTSAKVYKNPDLGEKFILKIRNLVKNIKI